MTDLAYMVREDWAQHGTAMVQQSAVIRNWIGEPPYLFAVTDVKKFTHDDRGADSKLLSTSLRSQATARSSTSASYRD